MSAKKVTNKDAVFEDLCKKFNLKTDPQIIPGSSTYVTCNINAPHAIKFINDEAVLDSFLAALKSQMLSAVSKKISKTITSSAINMRLSGSAHLQLTYDRLETEPERKSRLKREYTVVRAKVKREALAKEKEVARENKQRELYLKLKNKFEPS